MPRNFSNGAITPAVGEDRRTIIRAIDYGRYSTDLQNDKSVDDQRIENLDFIRNRGYKYVKSYDDRALSGAFIIDRPGISRLIEDAKRGLFDMVVSESPDRLSRSARDLVGMFEILRFHGVQIECITGGVMTLTSASLTGLIGQMQREDNVVKIRRGHAGVLRDKRKPSGVLYGYRAVPHQPGEQEIVPQHAKVVRLIHRLYVSGVSPRAIAHRLNAMGIPSPTGKKWNPSTLVGSEGRGTGIIANPHYVGIVTYGRTTNPKNPENGKRVIRTTRRDSWRTEYIERFRILDDKLFQKAVEKRSRRSHDGAKQPRSLRALSGKLKCQRCGRAMSIIGSDRKRPRIRCDGFRNSRICDNSTIFYMNDIEDLVLHSLIELLSKDEYIDFYIEQYREERELQHTDNANREKDLSSKIADLHTKRIRIMEKIASGLISDEDARDFLNKLRDDLQQAEEALAESPLLATQPFAKSTAIKSYKEALARLYSILSNCSEDETAELRQAFDQILTAVHVQPRKPKEPYTVRLEGSLSSLLDQGGALSSIAMAERMGFEPTRPFWSLLP